jgi:protocatechuate 3,4-dioxygenase beta subunit
MDHDHDGGFRHDLPRLLRRREALATLGAFALLGSTGLADAASCVANSRETAGPYPADGTNRRNWSTVNVLTEEGVIREDLRPNFGAFRGAAEGVALSLDLRLVSASDGCTPLAGHALYLWHCDGVGKYSLYDYPDRNYLRGVGISDASGSVRFTTAFPGCYPSRWPHLHFEVFRSIEEAVNGRDSLLTSQIALPEAECAAVYGASPAIYAGGLDNLGRLSFARDMIFADNSAEENAQQMMRLAGSARRGFTGSVTIGLA